MSDGQMKGGLQSKCSNIPKEDACLSTTNDLNQNNGKNQYEEKDKCKGKLAERVRERKRESSLSLQSNDNLPDERIHHDRIRCDGSVTDT